eukprot:TRINITY_DN7282_c0_g1_i1.p1 TRINITY_DN7282_c0_g1~~TRINITY_DN7282_c0_g1_i1.p1  ORF type:complete len:397 (-),score=98.77 TRINITY_DN7282_c0_g1_i1:19-1209(-)
MKIIKQRLIINSLFNKFKAKSNFLKIFTNPKTFNFHIRNYNTFKINQENIFVDEDELLVNKDMDECDIVDEKLRIHARKMDDGRFAEALVDFENLRDDVFKTESNDIISWFHFLRGSCNFHLGNIKDSIDDFLMYSEFELLENRRDKVIHIMQLGSHLENEDEALKWFEMCSQIDPLAVLPRYNIGMINAGMKLELESFEELKKAYQLFDKQPTCLIQGKFFSEMENKEAREGGLTEEDYKNSFNRLGKMIALSIADISNRGHISADDSYEILLNATEKFPNDPEVLNAFSLICISKSMFKEAEKILVAALKADPKFPNTLHNLASLFYRTNRHEEVIKTCNNALHLHPKHFPHIPHFYLSLSYRSKGDKVKADYHFKESKKVERKSILDEEEEEE